MALSPGDKLGPYEVVSLLGKGGMGEVYRARDPQLNRDVAIKVLPAALANDADYLARFQREAQTLASLNHPNIATIYGLEGNAIVMELVEGETLRGPLPLAEALPLAKQIAEALEAAHEKNIIHRDLKPGNVKVTPEGVVKVLDFGLAKALAERPTQSGPDSPTLTLRATEAGLILGTAGYMSPEQAVGKQVDRRADIWAFGVVLYELLTGKRLFDGETVSHTLAHVLTANLDLDAIPAGPVRDLLRRCLDRNPRNRLAHIAEARIAIENYAPSQAQPQPAAPAQAGWWPWAIAGALALALAAVSLIHFRETPPEQPVMATSINPPDKARFQETVISRDGKLLAFTAISEGRRQLWVRPLHSLSAQPLTGTEQATDPFWSPDSRWIGFFAQGKLKKIEASGGPTQTLCDVARPSGGTWNQDGVILYGALSAGLWRVSAQGGTPARLSVPDRSKGEGVPHWPVFLPDGRRYFYSIGGNDHAAGIHLGAIDSEDHTKLVGDLSNPGYAAGPAGEGYLLFVRENTLMAQRFDAGEGALAGKSFPVVEKVGVGRGGQVGYSASGNGMLVYGAVAGGGARLTWMDRAGKRLETFGEPGDVLVPALSPDGRQVAYRIGAAQGPSADVWVRDLARGIPTRFTFHPSNHVNPIWSPDGRRIVFTSKRNGRFNLYLKSASGAGQEERLLEAENRQFGSDWTAAGDLLLYYEQDPKTKDDLWVLPMTGERKPAVFLKTAFRERHGAFSPDGKWIAYTSDESGRNEIYVQPYPATGAKWQVSRDGGTRPQWRRDGREIYWLEEDGTLMAAEVSMGQTFQPGNPAALFETGVANQDRYAVTADGKRFLVPAPEEEAEGARPVTVVWNWLAGAKR